MDIGTGGAVEYFFWGKEYYIVAISVEMSGIGLLFLWEAIFVLEDADIARVTVDD